MKFSYDCCALWTVISVLLLRQLGSGTIALPILNAVILVLRACAALLNTRHGPGSRCAASAALKSPAAITTECH